MFEVQLEKLIYLHNKVNKTKGIFVYTALVISCKKNEENAWALIAKEKNDNDPNIDWSPVTAWSNHDILNLMLSEYTWKDKYISTDIELKSKIFTPEQHIFAFQELDKKSGKAKNDKAIYDSITSLMKAQGYELSSLDKRKNDPSIYNFNLISIVKDDLLRVDLNDSAQSIHAIDSEIYLSQYIINEKETASRVHFIKSDAFEECLNLYDRLHKHNVMQTNLIHDSYFDNCIEDDKKIDLFINKFRGKVRYFVYKAINGLSDSSDYRKLYIEWDKDKDSVKITVDGVIEEKAVHALNTNEALSSVVARTLKELYKYEGKIYFDYDIPF